MSTRLCPGLNVVLDADGEFQYVPTLPGRARTWLGTQVINAGYWIIPGWMRVTVAVEVANRAVDKAGEVDPE